MPSYGVYQGNVPLQPGDYVLESAQDGITATPSGTQVTSYQLTCQTSRVSTVATAGDGVKLPPSQAGLEVMVINASTKAITVYGSSPDTIDGVATATGVSQMGQSVVIYVCAAAGAWFSEGLATGYGTAGLATQSSQDALTAKAGGGQGGGPTINRMINRITTVATAADSVTLPASIAGMQITIINAAAANSMNVFPATGDVINALGANTAFAVAANKTATFYCTAAGQWHSVLTA